MNCKSYMNYKSCSELHELQKLHWVAWIACVSLSCVLNKLHESSCMNCVSCVSCVKLWLLCAERKGKTWLTGGRPASGGANMVTQRVPVGAGCLQELEVWAGAGFLALENWTERFAGELFGWNPFNGNIKLDSLHVRLNTVASHLSMRTRLLTIGLWSSYKWVDQ